MIACVSPAKKMDFGRRAVDTPSTEPLFQENALEIARVAARLSAAQIQTVMKLSDSLAMRTVAYFQDFFSPKEEQTRGQAILSFAGDTYVGFSAHTASKQTLEYAQENLRILSGLYGILRPFDVMVPYRLEMGSRILVNGKENLYDYWGDRLALCLRQELQSHTDARLINLASQEYVKAVPLKSLDQPVITPSFREKKEGELKHISFFAKKARGMMARWMCDMRLEKAEDLKAFDQDGYRYEPSLSDETQWIFVRG